MEHDDKVCWHHAADDNDVQSSERLLNLKRWVEEVLSEPHTDLGRKTVDSVLCEGIEANYTMFGDTTSPAENRQAGSGSAWKPGTRSCAKVEALETTGDCGLTWCWTDSSGMWSWVPENSSRTSRRDMNRCDRSVLARRIFTGRALGLAFSFAHRAPGASTITEIHSSTIRKPAGWVCYRWRKIFL